MKIDPRLDEDKETARPEKPVADHPSFSWKGPLIALAVIAVMIAIAVGVGFYKDRTPLGTVVEYNGFKFVKYQDLWHTQWKGPTGTTYNVRLRFNPLDVENVTVEGTLSDKFDQPNVFITFDPRQGNFTTEALAAAELALSLRQVFNINAVGACIINETSACVNRPVVTCENESASVILLQDINPPKLVKEDNCLIIQGRGMELLRVTDRVLYQWYRILEQKTSESPIQQPSLQPGIARLSADLDITVVSFDFVQGNASTSNRSLIIGYRSDADSDAEKTKELLKILSYLIDHKKETAENVADVTVIKVEDKPELRAATIAWDTLEEWKAADRTREANDRLVSQVRLSRVVPVISDQPPPAS